MSKGINQVTIIGNLGGDPELKFLPNGNAVANITIATSESWKSKETCEKVEKTEWHRVVFFRRLAEIVGEYLHKGSKVYIQGKLQTRKWQDKNGTDHYSTEIIASEMQMLDSRGTADRASPSPHPKPEAQSAPPKQAGMPDNDFDDETPF